MVLVTPLRVHLLPPPSSIEHIKLIVRTTHHRIVPARSYWHNGSTVLPPLGPCALLLHCIAFWLICAEVVTHRAVAAERRQGHDAYRSLE